MELLIRGQTGYEGGMMGGRWEKGVKMGGSASLNIAVFAFHCFVYFSVTSTLARELRWPL